MEHHVILTSKRGLFSLAISGLVIGSLLGGALWRLEGDYFFKSQTLAKFSSHDELVAFVKKGPQDAPRSLIQIFQSLFRGLKPGAFRVDSNLWETFDGEWVPEYSMTNIQVEGVDEADVVKTDGMFIYLVSGQRVYILRAYPPEEAKVLSKLDFKRPVKGIFVNGDILVVLQGGSTHIDGVFRFWTENTFILTYDISSRSNPLLERNVTVEGSYFGTRMIGDYVYTLINFPAHLFNDSVVILPEIRSGTSTIKVEASNIYHTTLPDAYDFFMNIVVINIQDAEQEPTVETFLLGSTSYLYVSNGNIYLTSSIQYPISGTNIHRISIEKGDIAYEANGFVPGFVLNQFSMDEYEGFFRIATSNGRANNVYTLDENLKVIGKLEDLAPGESIYSARFMGDMCYLVTFRKVDPLFVIDLKDPENPEVLGKLKIPGYSDYLHPYDESYLIGVGKETLPAEYGDFSWYQGVKISLFDVSNVSKPMEIAKFEIGDRGTESPVLRDHKAFLFSKSRRLLVLPILLAEIDEMKYPSGVPPNLQGEYVFQGAYVFNASIVEGIVLKGRITHLENKTDLMKSGLYFSSPYSVKRAIHIDQVLYTISDKRVKMNSIRDLEDLGVVELV